MKKDLENMLIRLEQLEDQVLFLQQSLKSNYVEHYNQEFSQEVIHKLENQNQSLICMIDDYKKFAQHADNILSREIKRLKGV